MTEKHTTTTYKVLRFLISTFYPKFELVGLENIPDDPCIIAGNHAQMNGPLVGELRLPMNKYIWCAGQMINKNETADYAYEDFWSQKPVAFRWFYRVLSHLIVPLCTCIFRNAHTIPVYHDSRVLGTFRDSLQKLQEGNHLVIFPEHDVKHNNIIYDFQTRFIDLAKMYYRKTKKPISFVPMYIAPTIRKVFFGAPIAFDPDAQFEEERTRILRLLMAGITELACSQPLHVVTPYRNIKKSDYPNNLPLEVYDEETGIL